MRSEIRARPARRDHDSSLRCRRNPVARYFCAGRDNHRAVRSFWDKTIIIHGLRRWYEIRGELRQEGQRISRHYYDLHCLHQSGGIAAAAIADLKLAGDCVRHAQMFFNRPDLDLASAKPGPLQSSLMQACWRDSAATTTTQLP